MIDLLRMHGFDETNLVSKQTYTAATPQSSADFRAEQTCKLGSEGKSLIGRHSVSRVHPVESGEFLAAKFLQLGLVIEEFQLRWAAGLEG